jgi:hypothetical protein
VLLQKLAEINEDYLKEVCGNRTPEGPSLEFKGCLPDRNDKGKFELAKDVSAFANSGGGDIVYGVLEGEGAARELAPIADESFDAACRRLGQVLDSGIEPRVTGLQFHKVDVAQGYILLLRVPASFAGPHRITLNAGSRFVVREATYVRDMSYAELRHSFGAGTDLKALALQTRNDAISRVADGRTWKPLLEGPICIVQIVPLIAVTGRNPIDIISVYGSYDRYMFDDWGGGSRALNLDGVAVYPGDGPDRQYCYNQIYRNGVMEAFSFAGHSFTDDDLIPSLSLAGFIREACTRFIAGLRREGITGPAAIIVSLVGVQGHRLGLAGNPYLRRVPISDRDILPLPETVVEIGTDGPIDELVRPLLNILWQCFGLTHCSYYDEQGQWQPPN